MKLRKFVYALPLLGMFLFSSCAMIPTPLGPVGLFTDVSYNATAASVNMNASSYTKVGKSEGTNILGLIQTGDLSVNAAMRNGEIKKVHHVDYKITNVLGLFATKTIIVYGE